MRVGFVSTYVPRRCGIATYTADLVDALSGTAVDCIAAVVAVDDDALVAGYASEVCAKIGRDDIPSYSRAALALNARCIDVASLQHEYGIFGGDGGVDVFALVDAIHAPIVLTPHTILREPNAKQREVLTKLCARSQRVVAASNMAVHFLESVYEVPRHAIDLIPHGVPAEIPRPVARSSPPAGYRLLTMGLLSENKGIEFVVSAMPTILDRFPDTRYCVVGATHPSIRHREGERYRESLGALARVLGVADHVDFIDEYVPRSRLLKIIRASDICVTPYRNCEQIVSGTLSLALACGIPTVSTPYWHAAEELAEGRGRLVPFDDARSIARAAIALLENAAERRQCSALTQERAAKRGWPMIGRLYAQSFRRAAVQAGAAR